MHVASGCYIGQHRYTVGLPGGAVVDNPAANAGDTGSVPGLRRSPELPGKLSQ